MKAIFSLLIVSFFLSAAHGQNLVIKGKIKCQVQTDKSTKGAENIVVVPAFIPSKATVTSSQPSGYFEFDTGLPLSSLVDKSVTIYVISQCRGCKEFKREFFISEDQDRHNSDGKKKYFTIKEWMLKTNCQKAELGALATDSILNMVVKQPGQSLDKISAVTSLTASPALLNLLNTVLTAPVFLASNQGAHYTDSFYEGKIRYGKFLFSSALYESANTGFNFSPSRDLSEAAFWNPSAIAFSKKRNNISVLVNIKNNYKISGFAHIGKRLSISAGGIYTVQDEFRKVRFTGGSGVPYFYYDSVAMRLREYAAFFGTQFKISKNLSIGVTGKSIWQHYNIPLQEIFSATRQPVVFRWDTVYKQSFDLDVSATYKIKNSLQIGVNLMNLAGTRMDASPYTPPVPNPAFYGQNDTTAYYQKLRSLGFGVLYRWKRFNAGADLLFTKDGLFDASFGVNYVPFNNALLSAGISVKHLGYSFAFRIKHFRVSYINDNDWLINQRKTAKSSILNGRIYGGFVMDFNQVIVK